MNTHGLSSRIRMLLARLRPARRLTPAFHGRLALALVAAIALFLIVQGPVPTANATPLTFNPTLHAALSDYGNLKAGDITDTIDFAPADATIGRAFTFWPSQEVVAHGSDLPIGAKIGTYHDTATIGISNGLCNIPLAIDFNLFNATTNAGGPKVSYSAGTADANSNSLPDAVDKYPLPVYDRGYTNTPRLRAYGQTLVSGVWVTVSIVVFDPGTFGFSASLGYVVLHLIDGGDPFVPAPSSVGVTAVCNPTHLVAVHYAVSADNPATGVNEAGYPILHNPYLAGVYTYNSFFLSVSDYDLDGVDNALDNCPLVANASQTDTDGDGVGDACDPAPGSANSDIDGDGYLNAQDNCPLVANGVSGNNQLDGDADGIGASCDPNDSSYGTYATAAPSDTVTITASADTDGDGWDNNTETYLGTDPTLPFGKCAASAAANNEPLPDAWPLDFNDDQRETLGDVLAPAANFFAGTFSVRNDLYPDGVIDVHDFAAFKGNYSVLCTGALSAMPTPVAGIPYTYGIDTDPTGNDARLTSGFGNGLQRCRAVSGIGTTFTVDVYVNTPAGASPLAGWQFNLVSNPSIIQVQSEDASQLLTQATGSLTIPLHPGSPDTTGTWKSAFVDIGARGLEPGGADETGGGVLTRVTFKIIANGESTLSLQGVKLVTPTNGEAPATPQYTLPNLIEVGGSCAANPVYTVNDTGTADDATPGDGYCLTAGGVCTLRAAVDEANAAPGPDTIHFNIPGSGVHTITAPYGAPTITDPVTIDATTQPGYSGSPLIEILPGGYCEGSPCNLGFEVSLGANPSAIKGFDIHGYGTAIVDEVGTTIQGNWIGTDSTGNAAAGNGTGIELSGPGNLVGGTGAGQGNIISGNLEDGIFILSDSNTIYGNTIGLAANGSALGNAYNGVNFYIGSDNTVGGVSAGQANVIAHNGIAGVAVTSFCQVESGCQYAIHDRIRGNSIYGNTGLGIDLVSAGSNDDMNSPVVTSVMYDGVDTTITGTLTTGSPATATVDVYSTQAGDPEGHVYLGQTTPNGLGAWTLIHSGPPPYSTFTATATDADGNTSEFTSPVYTAPPGSPFPNLKTVAKQGQSTPIGGTYSTFGRASLPTVGGDLVFWASVSTGSEGIFRCHVVDPTQADCISNGNVITKVAAKGDATPIGGTYSSLTVVPVANSAGDIVFWAAVTGGSASQAIFRCHIVAPLASDCVTSGNAITKIAAVGDSSPISGITYTGFTQPLGTPVAVVNGSGNISFFASLSSGGQGIFLYNQSTGLTNKVTATGDTAPTGGTYTSFYDPGGYGTVPIVTNNNQVAFWARVSSAAGQGVFLWDSGTVAKVAAGGDTIPGGGATYVTLGKTPMPNTSGQVVFWATLSGGSTNCASWGAPCGMFVRTYGATTTVLRSGDAGPAGVGGTISDIGDHPAMNGASEITVWIAATDGFASQAIVRYGSSANIAAVGNSSPIGGTFSTFIDAFGFPTVPLISNAGQVVFYGAVSGGTGAGGIFMTPAPAPGSPIVTLGPIEGATAPLTGGGELGPTFDLAVNDSGYAVFSDTVINSTHQNGLFMFFAGNPVNALFFAGNPLTTVALDNTPALNGDTYTSFAAPMNNSRGDLAVKTYLTDGTPSHLPQQAVYLFFAGDPASIPAPRKVARSGDDDGTGTNTFKAFSDAALNDGQLVAVQATLNNDRQGVYLFFAGDATPTPIKLVKAGETYSNASFTTTDTFDTPTINNSGRVAGKVTHSPTSQGLYLFFAGDAQPLAKTGVTLDDHGHLLLNWGSPIINTAGDVIAPGRIGSNWGIYRFQISSDHGVVTASKIADNMTTTGVGGTFSQFGPATIATTDVGMSAVASGTITGGGTKNAGLYLFFAGAALPSPKMLVGSGDPLPSPNQSLHFDTAATAFPYYAMSTHLRVVFVANFHNASGTLTQGVFFATYDQDGDGIPDVLDWCPSASDPYNLNTDQAKFAAGYTFVVPDNLGDACDDDTDGDGQLNVNDNFGTCDKIPTVWITPTGDADCDGFSSTVAQAGRASESFLGTLPNVTCSPTAGSDHFPDEWPVDFNNDQAANLTDIFKIVPHLNTVDTDPGSSQRFDLNGDGSINLTDIFKVVPFLNLSCAPP